MCNCFQNTNGCSGGNGSNAHTVIGYIPVFSNGNSAEKEEENTCGCGCNCNCNCNCKRRCGCGNGCN